MKRIMKRIMKKVMKKVIRLITSSQLVLKFESSTQLEKY